MDDDNAIRSRSSARHRSPVLGDARLRAARALCPGPCRGGPRWHPPPDRPANQPPGAEARPRSRRCSPPGTSTPSGATSTTEVALWNPDTMSYSECYEVLRTANIYFRSICQAAEPAVLTHGVVDESPLQFTETSRQRQEWLGEVDRENLKALSETRARRCRRRRSRRSSGGPGHAKIRHTQPSVLSPRRRAPRRERSFRGDEGREWTAMRRAGRSVAAAALADLGEAGVFPEASRVRPGGQGDALIAAREILEPFPGASADVFAFGPRGLGPAPPPRRGGSCARGCRGHVDDAAGRRRACDICMDGVPSASSTLAAGGLRGPSGFGAVPDPAPRGGRSPRAARRTWRVPRGTSPTQPAP